MASYQLLNWPRLHVRYGTETKKYLILPGCLFIIPFNKLTFGKHVGEAQLCFPITVEQMDCVVTGSTARSAHGPIKEWCFLYPLREHSLSCLIPLDPSGDQRLDSLKFLIDPTL